LVNQVQDVGGVSVLASVVEGVSGKDLRDIADKLKDKLGLVERHDSGFSLLGIYRLNLW
jgi:alanyl-tRNA synthetase